MVKTFAIMGLQSFKRKCSGQLYQHSLMFVYLFTDESVCKRAFLMSGDRFDQTWRFKSFEKWEFLRDVLIGLLLKIPILFIHYDLVLYDFFHFFVV
jgi:hypothetical protein